MSDNSRIQNYLNTLYFAVYCIKVSLSTVLNVPGVKRLIHYPLFIIFLVITIAACDSAKVETKITDHRVWNLTDIRITYLERGSDGNGNQYLNGYTELKFPRGVLELRDTSAIVSNIPDEITELFIITFMDEDGNVVKPADNSMDLYEEIVIGNYRHQLRREYGWGMNGHLFSISNTFYIDFRETDKDELFMSMLSTNAMVNENPYTFRAILTPQ